MTIRTPKRPAAAAVLLAAVAASLAFAGPGEARATVANPADGEIVYHYNSGSLQELRAMYPDGTGDHEIGPSSTTWYYGEPAASPDGSLIAFISDKDPNGNGSLPGAGIFVINRDGTGIRNVVYDLAPDAHPEWSPDGKEIVYESGGAIYTVGVDGTNERQVYRPGDVPYNNHWPAFSADGGSIVFSMRYEVTPGDPSQLWDAVEAGAPWDGKPWRFWQVARAPSTTSCSVRDSDINYLLPPEFVNQTCYLVPIYQLYRVPATGGTPAVLTTPQQFTNGETDPTHWTHVFADSLRSTRTAHSSGRLVTIGGSPNAGLGNFNPLTWHAVVVDADGTFQSLSGTHADANASVAFSPDDTRILYDCDTPLSCWGLHTVRLDGSGDFKIPNAAISFGVADWAVPPKPPVTPLIFVPGIMGSKIHQSLPCEPWAGDLWPTTILLDPAVSIEWLAMTASGHDAIGDGCLSVGGILDNVSVLGATVTHVYDKTLDYLTAHGYTLGGARPTLFPFPYDWRQSAVYNGDLLATFVRQVLAQTGAKQVDILAHSQGGLVTTAALEVGHLQGEVRRVVTMGTPLLGAAKSLGLLGWANPCPFEVIPVLGICPISPSRVQAAVEHMPGFYELLPSPVYEDSVGLGPMLTPDGASLGYEGWTAILTADLEHDANLVQWSGTAHNDFFDFFDPAQVDPGLQMLRMAGSDKLTVEAVQVGDSRVECLPFGFGCHSVLDGELVWAKNGDGTVPLGSALPPSGVQSLVLPGTSHMGLAQDDSALSDALAFLAPGTPAAPRFARKSMVALDESVQLETVGDVTGRVDDGSGGSIGADRPADAAPIPGAAYDEFLRSRYYSFDDAGTYTASLRAAGDSPVTVVLRRYGDVQQRALFFLPSPTARTELSVTLTTGADLADARVGVDTNGDGTIDETLAPLDVSSGALPNDMEPPTTIAGANQVSAGVSSVTLLAHDNDGGSGVAAIYYIPSGGSSPERYDGPFDAPIGSTVRYFSIDRLGNVEELHTLVVDDVSNERTFAPPLQPGDLVRRFIDPQGDEDWFTFQADGSSTYFAHLDGLTADYDLELYDASGDLVSASRTRGKASEEIRARPPTGTYYLRVVGYGGASSSAHPYTLKLQTLG